jgi:hypothetical protein
MQMQVQMFTGKMQSKQNKNKLVILGAAILKKLAVGA